MLIKRVSKTIENKAHEQKGGFIRMLLGKLSASLSGNMLEGKGFVKVGKEKVIQEIIFSYVKYRASLTNPDEYKSSFTIYI